MKSLDGSIALQLGGSLRGGFSFAGCLADWNDIGESEKGCLE